MSMYLNGTTEIVEFRIVHTWSGAWFAEADVNLGSVDTLPKGPVTLNIFDQILKATVDPTGTARFGEKSSIRVIGSTSPDVPGWSKLIPSQDTHNDAFLSAAKVIAVVAALVGETVIGAPVDPTSVDYLRSAGAASRVLRGFDWWVDLNGTTHLDPRPITPASDDVSVLYYDTLTKRLDVAADTLVLPGATFSDPNFGTLTARDVEQTFSASGSRASVWCADDAGSRQIAALLAAHIVEVTGLPFLKRYPYRIVKQGGDGRLDLQIISKTDGVPDALFLDAWYGVPGVSAEYNVTKGWIVDVVFARGDAGLPRIVGFRPDVVADVLHFDATTLIKLGKNAADFVALAAKVKANFDALNTVLTTGIPVVGGGGGTAKLASPIAFGSNAAAKTEAE